jgi:hypothetical protein
MLNRAISKFNEFVPAFKDQYVKVKGWDWKVIGICFFTSFTFWIFNALNDEHNYDLNIPLKFSYDKEKLVVLKEPPSRIVVNVSGNGWNLFKSSVGNDVKTEVISFENINTAMSSKFITTRSLLPKISSKLKELQVNYILQDSVFFDFDTLTTKEVHLELDESRIPLSEGFRIINDVRISPDKILLEGASSVLAQTDDTILLGIDEGDIDEDYSEAISLNYLLTDFITPLTEKVDVSFNVAEFEKRSINVGLELINFPKDSSVTVEPGTAVLYYFIEKDEQYMPRDSLKLVLDYTKMNRTSKTIKPIPIVPSYFLEYNFVPEKFTVNVEK